MQKVIAAALLLLAAPVFAEKTVGLAPVQGDAAPELARQTATVLYDELAQLDGFKRVRSAAMKRHLKSAAGIGIKCDGGEAACFARVGALANIALVVVPELVEAGSKIHIRVVQSAGSAVLGDVSAVLSADPSERSAGLKAVLRVAMIGGELTGKVVVEVSEPGARIKIDGRQVGASPMAALEIKAGRRMLTVTKSGFKSHEAEFEVLGGVTRQTQVTLSALSAGEPDKAQPPVAEPEVPMSGLMIAGITTWAIGAVAAGGLAGGALAVYVPESERPNFTAAQWNFRSRELAPALGWGAVAALGVTVIGGVIVGVALLE